MSYVSGMQSAARTGFSEQNCYILEHHVLTQEVYERRLFNSIVNDNQMCSLVQNGTVDISR